MRDTKVKGVYYMEKKKMKLWKKILIVIGIILILFLIITTRKVMILLELGNVSAETQKNTNYYIQRISMQDGCVVISKAYHKDAKHLQIVEMLGNTSETRKVTLYNDDNEEVTIIQSGENKIAFLNEYEQGVKFKIYTYGYGTDFWSNLQEALMSRITTEKQAGRECYVIDIMGNFKLWVDKENGLVLKEETENNVDQYKYELNTVKDEDVLKPDISDCVIQEKNNQK